MLFDWLENGERCLNGWKMVNAVQTVLYISHSLHDNLQSYKQLTSNGKCCFLNAVHHSANVILRLLESRVNRLSNNGVLPHMFIMSLKNLFECPSAAHCCIHPPKPPSVSTPQAAQCILYARSIKWSLGYRQLVQVYSYVRTVKPLNLFSPALESSGTARHGTTSNCIHVACAFTKKYAHSS